MQDRLQELASQFITEPLAAFLGATLDELRDGYAVISAPVRDEVLIAIGIVQGGITTAVADYAGVYAAMTRMPAGRSPAEGHTPATHIDIHLFRPIARGETIRAVARIENESKNSILTVVEVFGGGGKRKALATVLFSKPKPKP